MSDPMVARPYIDGRFRDAGAGRPVTSPFDGRRVGEVQDEFACTHLGKGRLVYVEGRLQIRQWQATDGSTRRSVEIVANRLQALSSKSTSEAPAA